LLLAVITISFKASPPQHSYRFAILGYSLNIPT